MTPSQEEWRPVVGYFGYEVSDQGRVRTFDRRVSRGPGRGTRLQRGCVLKQHLNTAKQRYQVGMWRDGVMSLHSVHVLVLEAFTGPRPEGRVGCHNDGDAMNNHVGNLRWDTQSSNIKDQVTHGTHASLQKTQCPKGHALVPPNLVASRLKRGHRICLTCTRTWNARRYARLAGRSFDEAATAASYYAQIMEAVDLAVHNSTDRQAG